MWHHCCTFDSILFAILLAGRLSRVEHCLWCARCTCTLKIKFQNEWTACERVVREILSFSFNFKLNIVSTEWQTICNFRWKKTKPKKYAYSGKLESGSLNIGLIFYVLSNWINKIFQAYWIKFLFGFANNSIWLLLETKSTQFNEMH